MALTVTILSKRIMTGVEYGSLKIQVPSADILALNTGSVSSRTFLGAPGSGKISFLDRWRISATSGTAYAGNTTLSIYHDTATVPIANSVSILLGNTTARITAGDYGTDGTDAINRDIGTTDTQYIADKAMILQVDGGNPTTGTFTLTIYLDYRIITL